MCRVTSWYKELRIDLNVSNHNKQQTKKETTKFHFQSDREKKRRNARFRISHLAKKKFFSIFLLSWEKNFFFEEFLFSHVKNSCKNEFSSTKKSKINDFLWKEKRFSSHFSLRKMIQKNFPFLMGRGRFFWRISLLACGKGRDCLPISLLNGHPVHFDSTHTITTSIWRLYLYESYKCNLLKNRYKTFNES